MDELMGGVIDGPVVTGWRCAVCGAELDIAVPMVWTCPNASPTDHHHTLQIVQPIAPLRAGHDANPFLAFRRYLAWDAFAAANGMNVEDREALIRRVDGDVAAVAGTTFRVTPFERADALSDELGFDIDGGVWVKDETGQVAGSHKPRHLLTILLHLLAAETIGLTPWRRSADRPPLAIASCGNAAFAAATLAQAVSWPIRVFVPPTADPIVVAALSARGAEIVTCPRRDDDPPGDPCIHRFREAVVDGSIPFTVQGPENAWCLDGGRTIGWEMARHFEERVEGPPLDRVFVQVGAGTFAACVAGGFRMSGIMPRLHAVQTQACAPLARAWGAVGALGGVGAASSRWDECMWPWESVGTSAADGILDDETYDWIPVVRAMADGRGRPVVVTETLVREAYDLGRTATGIDVSATGTAGLAGLLAVRNEIDPTERVAVVFSGVRRS